MVEVGTGTASERFVKRNWPITEGLTAGTQKQEGRKMHLEPEGADLTDSNERVLL